MLLSAARKALSPKPDILGGERGAVTLAPLIAAKKSLDIFHQEDIKPRLGEGASTAGKMIKQITPGSFAPEGNAKLRSEMGWSTMMRVRTMDALSPVIKIFDKLSRDHPDFGVGFMDYVDTADRSFIDRTVNPDRLGPGYKHINHAVNSIRKKLVSMLDEQHDRERAVLDPLCELVGRDKMGERTNYFPIIEKRGLEESGSTNLPETLFQQIFGGRAGFTHHREFETHSAFQAAGHTLATTNPAEMTAMRLFEGEKARLAASYVMDAFAEGRAQLLKHYVHAPEGYRVLEGPLFRGDKVQIWLPEGEARLINNMLSNGLSNKGWFRSLRVANNSLNQLQLGLSGYHGMTTILNVGATRLGMAAEDVLRGNMKGAALNFGKAILAPVDTGMLIKRGVEIKKSYRTGEGGAVGTAETLARVGARIGQDPATMGYGQGSRYSSAYTSMVRAWQRGNWGGALVRSPMAITEIVASPIFSHMVPDVKLALGEEMMAQELARFPDATEAEATQIRQKVWDTLDNRFGQLVYDNGSPPRVWGQSLVTPGHKPSVRFTPTCVGTMCKKSS